MPVKPPVPISQPKFTFTTQTRPVKWYAPGLTAKEYRVANENQLLKNYNPDYGVEIYFKNVSVRGNKNYTMGDLAHHLMVEGQYSKGYGEHFRGPRPFSFVRQRDGLGNAVVASRKVEYLEDIKKKRLMKKYALVKTRMHKKVWNFVENAAKKNKNWKNIIINMTTSIIREAIHKNVRGENGLLKANTNYYRKMQELGKRIVLECKAALLALETPPLDPQTIKKKGHDKILIESRKLYNSIAYRVVPLQHKEYYGWKQKQFLFGKGENPNRKTSKTFNPEIMDKLGKKISEQENKFGIGINYAPEKQIRRKYKRKNPKGGNK